MQPCAICTGPTERGHLRIGQTLEASNWCPRCRVFTADADGREAERWARFNDLRTAIVRNMLTARRRPAS